MRLLNLILASIFAMCVVAAPTDFELHSPLAIPVPGSTTYDADVASAIAYARSHPSSDAVKTSDEGPRKRMCGDYLPGNRIAWSTGTTVCIDLDEGIVMERFTNRQCGFCIVFKEHQCGGDIIGYWGQATPPLEKPADKSHPAKGGKSYFCY